MRKLIFVINITLDGCCDHTKGIPDDDLMEFHTDLLRDADTLVYGRKTFELMVPYWPDIAKDHSGQTKADIDFAEAFVAIDTIAVFSKTLKFAEGKNTRIIDTNLEEEIIKLKKLPGKNILTGGADIPSQLIRLGLVDEFQFVILPIIAGEGRRLLDNTNLTESLKLKLIDSKIFPSGCVVHRYLKK
jgi:dihydrofolate reductase